jgi:hypothetical protein
MRRLVAGSRYRTVTPSRRMVKHPENERRTTTDGTR